MARSYRTAQGKSVDIEKLRLQNELIPAVGNMRVNARGDQLGPGGQIVKSREQMLDDHYNSNIRRNRGDDGSDEIPTAGGKAKKVEQKLPADPFPDVDIFEDETAGPDPIIIQDEPATAPDPKKRTVKKKPAPAPEPVAEEVDDTPIVEQPSVGVTDELTITEEPEPKKASAEFEFTGDTEESVTKETVPPKDPITGFSKGGKTLKGGLAKAVAKTKAYEKQKNPGPKRM